VFALKKETMQILTQLSVSLETFIAVLDGPSILHVLPALVHCTVINAFKGTINLKSLHLGQ
jgi:hypothetical protein